MFAFVTAALPVRSFAASLSQTSPVRAGPRLSSRSMRMMADEAAEQPEKKPAAKKPAAAKPAATKAEKPAAAAAPPAPPMKSPAMPFANAPAAIPKDIPGYAGFDPWAFSSAFDIKFLQEAEIKHGRVCMLAVLGLIVPEFFTFPFYHPPANALPASKEMHDYFVRLGSLTQIFFWVAFAEIFGAYALRETLEGDRPAGYFGLDPLGVAGSPGTAKWARFQLHEIKNGRLAMCAVGGIIHQQFITHQPTIYNLTHFKGIPVSY